MLDVSPRTVIDTTLRVIRKPQKKYFLSDRAKERSLRRKERKFYLKVKVDCINKTSIHFLFLFGSIDELSLILCTYFLHLVLILTVLSVFDLKVL